MGWFKKDNRVSNHDPNLLAQVRACKMGYNGEPYTRREAFEAIRDKYTLTSDEKIWAAIDYIYDDD